MNEMCTFVLIHLGFSKIQTELTNFPILPNFANFLPSLPNYPKLPILSNLVKIKNFLIILKFKLLFHFGIL